MKSSVFHLHEESNIRRLSFELFALLDPELESLRLEQRFREDLFVRDPEEACAKEVGCRYGSSRSRKSETVRKASEVLTAEPCGPPRRGFSAHFILRLLAKSTLGALLVPLFGQFL